MPVLASQRLAAEFLCRQWGRCLLTLSLPQCQGGAQEHPEAEAEVGALEAHTEQPVGRGQGPSALTEPSALALTRKLVLRPLLWTSRVSLQTCVMPRGLWLVIMEMSMKTEDRRPALKPC